MRRSIALMTLASCIALAGAAWADVVSDPDDGLLEFRSSPDAPTVGDTITLTARFDAARLSPGTVSFTVTDGRKSPLDTSKATVDAQGQASAQFVVTEGMAWARVRWQVQEWDDGRIEIEHEDEELWLNVKSGGSGGGSAGSGLYAYRVTDQPLYSGDDMEIEVVFTTRPDAGSVRLELDGVNGTRTIQPNGSPDQEGGLWVYEFDFHIEQGRWTPTLVWTAGGASYRVPQEPFTVGGPYDGRIPSGGNDTGDLYGCWVTDWPDHVGDDTEIKAVFNVQPQTVTLIMVNGSDRREFIPTERDFEGGRYVYEFDVYLPQGTWTPTVQWTSASATSNSAPQRPITIRTTGGGSGGGGGGAGEGGGGGCDAMAGLGGLALAAVFLSKRR